MEHSPAAITLKLLSVFTREGKRCIEDLEKDLLTLSSHSVE